MANESFSTFIEWGVEKCENARVGYSQTYREGEWTTAYSADTAYTNGQSIQYYDCSSFVYYALGAAGFPISGGAFNTGNDSEEAWLLNHGWQAVSAGGEYKQGDIGKTSGKGHTEVCYKGGNGCGLFMGAHGRNRDDGGGTVPLPNQVSIGKFGNNGEMLSESSSYRSFAKLYRYYDWDGSSPEPEPSKNAFSMYVAAAMAGNFYQESGINPGIWESLVVKSVGSYFVPASQSSSGYDEGGYGLGQWTNTTGSTRLLNLYNYLTGAGYAFDSGDGQVTYIKQENIWQTTGSSEYEYYGNLFPSLDDFFYSDSTDLEILTHAWNRCWEGIHDPSWDVRVEYAKTCYDYIAAHYDDDSIMAWIAGNRHLSESERLNNAVMLYRALNSLYGNGSTITNPDGNLGDTGDAGSKQMDDEVSFEDFLMSLLGNKGEKRSSIHIKSDRSRKK